MRPYNNGVPKNALVLALDMCGSHSESTIVGLLVTAGAQMTGNSKIYQCRTLPFQWRRVRGPQTVYGETGYQGRRLDPMGEANLRRSDRSASVVDPPHADLNLDVGMVTADGDVDDDLHPLAEVAGQQQPHTMPDAVVEVNVNELD